MEEWRVSPSLPEYEVSSLGRVRRITYTKAMPRGGERTYGGAAHFGQEADGRMIFVFRQKSYKVHQLVCEAFHGQKPFPKAVVMHHDENFKNNAPGNLRWGTQKENLNYPGFKNYAKQVCRSKFSAAG